MDARMVDCSHHRDRLTAKLDNFDRHARLPNLRGQPFRQGALELFYSKTSSMDPADQRQVDLSTGIYTDRFIRNLFDSQRPDFDLVLRAQHVLCDVVLMR